MFAAPECSRRSVRFRSLRVGAVLGLCAGLLLFAATVAQAVTRFGVTATIGVGFRPTAVAVDLSTHNVYVTNYNGTVSVIDESGDANSGTVTATIPVGD